MATIEEVLVPVFLGHRYQVEAVVKSIGGQRYSYALRGDGQEPLEAVAASDQRRALTGLLATLTPGVLRLPEALLRTLPARPVGFAATRELFDRRTGLAFDALAPAEAAAEPSLALLFHPERAARLVQQNARDPKLPGLEEVITAVLDATWGTAAGSDYDGEVQRTVNYVALRRLFHLAANPAAAPQVQAVVTQTLADLRERLNTSPGAAPRANLNYGARQIGRFLDNPKEFMPPPVPTIPPGQPIGAACDW